MFRSTFQQRRFLPSLRPKLHRRMLPAATPAVVHRQLITKANCQRGFDEIPGSLDPIAKEDRIRFFTDSVNYFSERYSMANQTPILKLKVAGHNAVVLLSHDAVKQWHQYELQYRTKREGLPILEKLQGRAFAEMHGSAHSEWRKKVMPSFKPKSVGTFAPFIQHSAQRLLYRIHEESKKGKFVQLNPTAKRFAYDIGSKFVYGPLLNDEERDHTFELFQQFANGLTPEGIVAALDDPDNPDTVWADALRAKDELRTVLGPKYAEAQRLTATDSWDSTFGEDADSLIRSMLENEAEFTPTDDYTLNDRVDITLILALAAYDTSATSITQMIYSMWQNPEETEKVREAILAHSQLSDPDTIFTFDLLKSCNELECFINESQRVHSFLPSLLPRFVDDENGIEIAGYHIPKGTELIIPLQFLHNGEGSWTDPLEFRPSRFDKSNGEKKADRGSIGAYNHIPFATGLHKCLGMHLALIELRTYSILLLRDWEFEIDESKLTEEGTVNHMNVTMSVPHFNVYLKLKQME